MESFLLKLAETGLVGVALAAIYLAYRVIKPMWAKPPALTWEGESTDVRQRPVTAEVCNMRQKAISQQFAALGESVEKIDNKISGVAKDVNEIRSCVAVLKDRSNRNKP